MPTLSVNKDYKQNDSAWANLNPNFAAQGCAVCCAANLASFAEKADLSPAEMKKRGVFTSTSMLCVWGNATSKLTVASMTTPTDYLAKTKAAIDNGVPLVIVLNNPNTGNDHYVVAYAYNGSASAASDILVRDPGSSSANTYLSQSMSSRGYLGIKVVTLK
jgi:hypothetical protein